MKIIRSLYAKLSILFCLIACPLFYCIENDVPRVTIIIEVDQFAYHYISRIEKYLTGGIKMLLQRGINYTNAYWPHAMPSTAIGHTALNTGTFADYHGVINNSWYDKNLKKIKCDDDFTGNAAVFSSDGLYSHVKGKSADNIMVDGISDQLMLASTKRAPIIVYALSHKSRAAIGNAGKLGKAIWFDAQAGRFTSSKAYFNELPTWLKNFNKKLSKRELLQQKWKPYFSHNEHAYNIANGGKIAPLQRTLSVLGDKVEKTFLNYEKPSAGFLRTPAANTLLFNLAKAFFSEQYLSNNRIVLWVSLSPLDKLGHFYGPHSKEVFDMIYHLDYQLKNFFDFIHNRVKQSDVLYVLTADHGTAPFPEYLYNKGMKNARRMLVPNICKNIERLVKKKHGISLKCAIKTPQLYLDDSFNLLDEKRQKEVLCSIKEFLEKQEGIRRVWTYKEAIHLCVEKGLIENYYKHQQYPGRSGHIIFQVMPHTQVTKYPAGTAHCTPYEWNTHVPLIIYQKGIFENKSINDRIWLLQLPNTLAQIHNVPKPSASTYELLPGIL